MTLRNIVIQTADGQRNIIEYDTGIEGLDDDALETEVRAALQEQPMYVLQTHPNGSTATFYAEVETVAFLT